MGLCEAGAQVTDIGMCGTEEIYYAAANQPFEAGVIITGSHNPADENGFKLVRGGAIPISGDSGLFALRDRVAAILAQGRPETDKPAPPMHTASFRADYVAWLLEYSGVHKLASVPGRRPLKIVADAGNGCAGLVRMPGADAGPAIARFAQFQGAGPSRRDGCRIEWRAVCR